jgi:hypothetical protein
VRPLSGRFDVVTQDGQQMLRAAEPTEFLITLAQRLPENFTIEVDLIPKECCPPPDLTLEGTPEINQGPASAHLLWQADGYVAVVGGAENNREFPMPEDLQVELKGTLTQVGVSVQGKAIRLYTNGRELYAVEAQFARGRYLRVTLGGGGGGDDGVVHPVYLARIRVATGAPAQALVALPAETPTATITPIARPAAVKENSLGTCGLFTNLTVTASSLTTTRIRWDAINADCSSLAASQGMSLGSYDIVRWAGSNAAGCPTEYDDLVHPR